MNYRNSGDDVTDKYQMTDDKIIECLESQNVNSNLDDNFKDNKNLEHSKLIVKKNFMYRFPLFPFNVKLLFYSL